jgi:uncharacterized protein YggE
MKILPCLLGALPWLPLLTPAQALAQQVQLRCEGTLVEARGSAEQKRSIERLSFSLGLEAEALNSDGALAILQQRLAAVRLVLQRLEVGDLEVSSPTTWERPASRERRAAVEANLQVSGQLAPARFQALIRQVGSLPGVRLAPITAKADPRADPAIRRRLLRAAFEDAQRQAREVAEAFGSSSLSPLEVQVESGFRPRPMLAKAVADAAPPFEASELPPPTDQVSMTVRFCAR